MSIVYSGLQWCIYEFGSFKYLKKNCQTVLIWKWASFFVLFLYFLKKKHYYLHIVIGMQTFKL